MDRFTQLYDELDATGATSGKEAALVRYFREADPEDAAWALYFLAGHRLPRGVTNLQLRAWAAEAAELPLWLVDECREAVGDQAETLSLLVPEPAQPIELPLRRLVEERLAPLKRLDDAGRRELILRTWSELTARQRFLFHKLMGGAFRVGVGRTLVARALARAAGVSPAVIAHRLMGEWRPTPENYRRLLSAEVGANEEGPGRPYPFLLAQPLDGPPERLGDVTAWQIEWKWDGIRAQLLRRGGGALLWSRGEELLSDRFPELMQAAGLLPEGIVLDGEVLGWAGDGPLPFSQLQKRIGRKRADARIQAEVPVVFLAYDLLEEGAVDLRQAPLEERRRRLETHFAVRPVLTRLRLSPSLAISAWSEAHAAYDEARGRAVEGLMLKRRASPYGVGRSSGDWRKWKLAPRTLDAVLLYAQAGSGKRANLFTDYTFAVWDGDKLAAIAKAYSGLTKQEIEAVDRFIRANTTERFGPVRVVKPELVFELTFEGVQESKRHKAGLALRFPRIGRWRTDKNPKDADTLETVRRLAGLGD